MGFTCFLDVRRNIFVKSKVCEIYSYCHYLWCIIPIKCCLATLLYFCAPVIQRCCSGLLWVSEGEDCTVYLKLATNVLHGIFLFGIAIHILLVRMGTKYISDDEKALIFAWKADNTLCTGHSNTVIMCVLAPACLLPSNMVPQYNQHCGRLRKASSRTSKMLRHEMMNIPYLTAAILKKITQNYRDTSICTIQHWLQQDFGMPSDVSAWMLLLTRHMIK